MPSRKTPRHGCCPVKTRIQFCERKRLCGMPGLRIIREATGRKSWNLRKCQIILPKPIIRPLARLFFYAQLGEKAKALDSLEEAYEQRSTGNDRNWR